MLFKSFKVTNEVIKNKHGSFIALIDKQKTSTNKMTQIY